MNFKGSSIFSAGPVELSTDSIRMEQLETKTNLLPGSRRVTSSDESAISVSAVEAVSAAPVQPSEWEYALDEHREARQFLWFAVGMVVAAMLSAAIVGPTISFSDSGAHVSGKAFVPIGFLTLAGYFIAIYRTHAARETHAKEHCFGISGDQDNQ